MKIYSAVTVDALPLTEVLEGSESRVFPHDTEVLAIHAGNGRWHVTTKEHGFVFAGAADAGQLAFADVLVKVADGGRL